MESMEQDIVTQEDVEKAFKKYQRRQGFFFLLTLAYSLLLLGIILHKY